MTKEEEIEALKGGKNKTIAETLGICWCDAKWIIDEKGRECSECKKCKERIYVLQYAYANLDNHRPDFFTHIGQARLARVLREDKNAEFLQYYREKYKHVGHKDTFWLLIIADSKLAEIFYEFIIEGEK